MRGLSGQTLVVATHNRGKQEEIADLLAPYGVTVLAAGDLGLAEPVETESTFVGNARIKAHAAAQATGLPALSDDAQGYAVDWDQVGRLDDESLVNGIAQIAPFDAAAKQALLEAADVEARAELIIQLLQFFGRHDGEDRVTLQ